MRKVLIIAAGLGSLAVIACAPASANDCALESSECLGDPPLFVKGKNRKTYCQTIVGTVSTYNPYRGGNEEGGAQTASGEPYDPAAWTAAIKFDLQDQFGGIRYGKLYQPAFALVESGDKQLIVKINDVGPLRPGRVLDLSERSMRHFDPSLDRGLITDVKITPLPGEGWTPGPVGGAYTTDFNASEWCAASALFDPSVRRVGIGIQK